MVRNMTLSGLVSLLVGGLALTPLAVTGIAGGQDKPTSEKPAQKADQAAKPQPRPMGGGMTGPAMGQRMMQKGMSMGKSMMGMMGGGMGQQGQGMMPMMCPCMRMMMGGGMMGGQMGSTGHQQSGTAGQSGQTGSQASATEQPSTEPVNTDEQARKRAEDYLKSVGNPNLRVGKVEATRASYEVQVVTKDNSEVNWIIIDKRTGQVRTLY